MRVSVFRRTVVDRDPDSCILTILIDNEVIEMAKVLKIKFYSDDRHGWAAVKLELLQKLGIVEQISAYSYYRGASAYIEEDGDLCALVNALKAANIPFEFQESKSRPAYSPIRSYDSFRSSLVFKSAQINL